jgi:NAD+ synthase
VSATPHPLDLNVELVEQLLVRFLRIEARKFGFQRTILGLSGGIDSAVSAALAARAYGPEQVLGVMMPYRTSSPASEGDARTVATALGIRLDKTDISALADGYLSGLPDADRLRRGNVMARCRMLVLYDRSVPERALVIGTSNKTELLLGYSTQFGDAACALNPLGDLYKHQVWQLARHLGLPSEVIDKPPTADLFEGQTDEGELGFSYAEADGILHALVDERRSVEEVVQLGWSRTLVERIVTRMAANQYKRQPPLVAKLGERTVTHDFRYLRDWGR